MHLIYKISSTICPDRVYIGSAVTPKRRKKDHFRRLRVNQHPNKKLQNHANKYGVEDLKFEELEIVEDKSKLIEREQHYIDTVDPYFNICRVAGSRLGAKLSEESKEKMRIKASRKRKPLSKEHRDNVSKGMKEKRYGNKTYLENNNG